jgi:hypothetical protein
VTLFSEPVVRAAGRRAAMRASSTAPEQLRQLERVRTDGAFDVFLSHNYLDAELVLGLRETINAMGFSVYVDWVDDAHLRRSDVSRETAACLRQRMANSAALFYATSITSPTSKWMPWECGFFDGLKGRVAICPLTPSPQADDKYSGQEYLGLYPYVTTWCRQGDSEPTLWIHETQSKYVNLSWWLKGGVPHEPHASR